MVDTTKLLLIEQRVANERKSAGVAYLLWFFLGGLSAHNIYLENYKSAALQITLIPAGAAMIFSGYIFGVSFIIFWALWMILDLFWIPGTIREHSESIRRKFAFLAD